MSGARGRGYVPTASATLDRIARNTSGFAIAMLLMVLYVLELPPSTMYVASVHGAPTKPRTAAVSPTSSRRIDKASPTKGSMSRSRSCMASTAFMSRTGWSRMGPL